MKRYSHKLCYQTVKYVTNSLWMEIVHSCHNQAIEMFEKYWSGENEI